MASVNDWAAKAAKYLHEDLTDRHNPPTIERVAAIIATFAEPLMTLLREARREHTRDCATERREWECTCGADAWNARVDAALVGEPRPHP